MIHMTHKPNPFPISLNQPPKGPHLGKHRRTAPQAHRDPTDGADSGAGRAFSRRTDTTFVATFSAGSLMPTFARGGGRNVTLADCSKFMAHPPIPYAGVRSGEIIAYRLWWVIDGKLCSWIHRQIWEPGKAMQGDINAVVDSCIMPIYGGVYGFASTTLAAVEVDCFIEETKRYSKQTFVHHCPIHETSLFVLGSIALWGEVVEHERGWRGEFAKVNSIDQLYNLDGPTDPAILQHLRTTYALPQPKLPDLPRKW